MRLLATALLLLGASWAKAGDDAIQRYLADLYLGDSLSTAQKLYPPTRDWPKYLEPRGRVNRIKVESRAAKKFPAHVETMWLGFKSDRLVEVELIYDAQYTREKSLDELASDLALIYGEPKRGEDRFWWSDGKTVLRTLSVSVPALDREGQPSSELRTALQLFNAGLFHSRKE